MTRWHALDAATLARVPRVPLYIGGAQAGSVAVAHLPMLAALRHSFGVGTDRVDLDVPAAERDAAFTQLNDVLRARGLIAAWRDEIFAVVDPASLAPLACFERAASRFWGTLTFGAHATGYVAGPVGRPARLWIAQRSFTKVTDPGLYDNLVGGGVAAGQTPEQALVREAFEEAGLGPAQLPHVQRGSVLRLARDIPEGFQHEWLHSFDLALPAGLTPSNQDGEVAGFQCLAADEALALAAGRAMTVDAALVTIDFALRHGLLDAPDAARCVQALRVVRMC